MTADGMRLGESEQMLNMPQTDDRDRGINVGRERVRERVREREREEAERVR